MIYTRLPPWVQIYDRAFSKPFVISHLCAYYEVEFFAKNETTVSGMLNIMRASGVNHRADSRDWDLSGLTRGSNRPWKVSIDCSIETVEPSNDVRYLNKMLCSCGCSRKHVMIGQVVVHNTSCDQSSLIMTQQLVALTSANNPINEKSLRHLIDASEAKIESWNSHQSFLWLIYVRTINREKDLKPYHIW